MEFIEPSYNNSFASFLSLWNYFSPTIHGTGVFHDWSDQPSSGLIFLPRVKTGLSVVALLLKKVVSGVRCTTLRGTNGTKRRCALSTVVCAKVGNQWQRQENNDNETS